MNKSAVLVCGILCILKFTSALDYNKQRVNTNADFLLHEGGLQTSEINTNQNGNKRDYVAQFPPLGPPATPQPTAATPIKNLNSGPQPKPQSADGKRDYIASQFPALKPIQNNHAVTPVASTDNKNAGSPQNSHINNGKGDNLVNLISTPKPSTTATNNKNNEVQRNPLSSSGKRDYVAPQFPTLKPVQNNQPTGGKVKDLVNFYDSKSPSQKPPSYSSIVQGPTNKNGNIPTASPIQPTKPMSFSSVVSGPNKGITVGALTPTTAKPSRHGSRPGTPTLPSSIVNNNRGTTNNNGNTVTDSELQTLSEELLRKDVNNAARYVTINYQEKTTSYSLEDKAPQPLLTIAPEAWNLPTVQKFVPLLDNYERDVLVNEHVTPQERIEENAFMDAVMSTTVMRHLMTFLKNKGYVTPDPKQQRDFVKQLWFTLYSRGKGKLGSSGFEHTFVSELKSGGVSGLHNWIYFSKEEAANRANYLGYLKYVDLGDKGAIVKFHFNQQGVDKPVNSIFIGTSPELELALYTLCYVTRVDNDCKLKLANKDVNIITYNFRYRSKNLVGSAFPQI